MKNVFFILGLIPFLAAADPAALAVDKAMSRIEIDVRATVDSFTGRLADFEPVILLDEAGEVDSATVTFHFADVKTGKDERDKQMHAWQQTAEHPDGVFKLNTLAPDENGRLQAGGTLTLHGVGRELHFPVSIFRDGSLLSIDGAAHLDTRDFGLPVIRKFMLLRVDPDVTVRFHLQGRTGSAASE